MERSTKTFDETPGIELVAENEGTKTGADSAKEGTNTGADERKEGTNSVAAGLNENSRASTLRDRKGLDVCKGPATTDEALSRAARTEEQGITEESDVSS